MSASHAEPYDPSWLLGKECLVCHAPAPVHGLPVGYEDGTLDGVMLWCDPCWEAREARSAHPRGDDDWKSISLDDIRNRKMP